MEEFNRIHLVHLSDIHFGKDHICTADEGGAACGIHPLSKLIAADLENPAWLDNYYRRKVLASEVPLFVAVTGDFTQSAASSEFASSIAFLKEILSVPLVNRGVTRDHVFFVPGNHDVVFTESDYDRRFQPFCSFQNQFFEDDLGGIRPYATPHKASELTRVHVCREQRVAFALVNSCLYVEKETVDESRGQVDFEAIRNLRRDLEDLGGELKSFIKVALVHHHPILIPSLIEKGKAYDSILNSNSLLRLLQEYGFHMVLHGHKHSPHIFTFDPDCAWNPEENRRPALLVLAGGSCGSRALPTGSGACNTYNFITFSWHPGAREGRVQIITRGLKRIGPDGQLDPDQWKWETLRTFDRPLRPYSTIPTPQRTEWRAFHAADKTKDVPRTDLYQQLRGNMPVVEVMPSFVPRQGYEARVWIVPHTIHDEWPEKVTWSAGKKFPITVCYRKENPSFACSFHYWGPMLIQAELEFEDGRVALGYVYARMPRAEE